MCRCSESEGVILYPPSKASKEKETFRIRAIYLRVFMSPGFASELPEVLTLVYFPRIIGGVVEVNGAKGRQDAPAFASLYRVRSAEAPGSGEALFASTDRIRATEGARFEVYVGEERAVSGAFRRKVGWEMECRCDAEIDLGFSRFEVGVVEEGGDLLTQKVEVPKFLKSRRRRCEGRGRGTFYSKLQEIPEERVEEEEEDGCCCCSCCGGSQWELVSRGEEGEEEEEEEVVEVEGVKWAVDVGIWVVCLGVGLLVSKASAASYGRRSRRSRFFF